MTGTPSIKKRQDKEARFSAQSERAKAAVSPPAKSRSAPPQSQELSPEDGETRSGGEVATGFRPAPRPFAHPKGMHEYKIAFAAHSRVAAFVSPEQQNCSFEHLTTLPSEKIYIGCQVGKVYRMVLRENHRAYALLVVLLEFVAQPKKKSKQGTNESWEETAARQSSPRSWLVAHIPTPESFVDTRRDRHHHACNGRCHPACPKHDRDTSQHDRDTIKT